MADDNTPEQAAEEAAAKEKADADKAEADATAAEAAEDEPFDKDRAMSTIHKQREEAKALKAELKEAKEKASKLDEIEAEKLSDQEKAEKRADAAEAKAAEADKKLRRANLIAELSKPEHGIVNAQAAAKLLDGVEYSDDGEPSNIADILPGFLTENAFLKGSVKTTPGEINPGGGQTDGKAPDLTADELDAAGRIGMTPAEYAGFKGKTSIADLQAAETAAKAAA